jgi:hypothetical protein
LRSFSRILSPITLALPFSGRFTAPASYTYLRYHLMSPFLCQKHHFKLKKRYDLKGLGQNNS